MAAEGTTSTAHDVFNASLEYASQQNATKTPSWPDYPEHYSAAFQAYWAASPQRHVIAALHVYAAPVLLLLGTAGNVLACGALRHKLSKHASVFFYLALYAVTNSVSLWLACGLVWLSSVTHTQYIANQADWICRVWTFVFSVLHYTSPWLVVLTTFDRLVYVCAPARVHSLCTVFSAKALSTLVVVMLVVVSTHAMWSYQLLGGGCGIDESSRRDVFTHVWPYVAATVYIYLPIVLIVVFSLLIVINLLELRARRYQSRNTSPLQQRLTLAVLVIAATLVVFYLPTVVINVLRRVLLPRLTNHDRLVSLIFAIQLNEVILWLSCCVNLPLYLLVLPQLRHELRDWLASLCCQRRESDTDATMLGTIEVNGALLSEKTDDSQPQQLTAV